MNGEAKNATLYYFKSILRYFQDRFSSSKIAFNFQKLIKHKIKALSLWKELYYRRLGSELAPLNTFFLKYFL